MKIPGILLLSPLLLLIFTVDASAQFECAGFRGTCKKSPDDVSVRGQFSCYEMPSKTKGIKDLYCPFFQCDDKDNVRMSKSTEKYRPPGMIGDAFINGGTLTAPGVICYANCCYGSPKGNFLGEINVVKGCKNICCSTLEAYLARDCSRANSNPPPKTAPPAPPSPPGEIEPGPGEIEEPPLFPGEIENNSKPNENPLFGNEYEF